MKTAEDQLLIFERHFSPEKRCRPDGIMPSTCFSAPLPRGSVEGKRAGLLNNSQQRSGGFTLFEVMIALGVFAIAVTGLITALNTAMQAALEVRERSVIRAELESRIALRMGIPLDKEKLVIAAKENHGIGIEESIVEYPLKNKDGVDITNIKKLTITATLGRQSDSASILVNE